ncbi:MULTISPECIES: HAMP domain-containing sensor histidine kinase [unclassified Paracoccus (in: a-proteobacteria)]|uniref:sensor histidine kinase n=1 Tax=unclassified Paracoccus (in: a-proteobacteria) TaxID=2688777 RepID=UPI00160075D5|nr:MULTISPECIES: HAMP domain-containing sensor histidine kinase [unclassified Paracoccus (in: a-proteobacteria)]MBB1490532.1 HAMP domain-containing histidine kinase [Paracoccus sp. MC1854]MBB1499028.1 HAMP domain-containing histidine kinase [Paracoccus sp. MC1862]QQO44663.1 HAMP domain-containing histidine kinase [Paracoccus sp. MC1862]
MTFNSISGRFALLTIVFVLLAEILILVPSVTNFRRDYLETRLERAQIASLALLATDESIAADLESELLENAGVFNVVLRRDDIRQLVLSSALPQAISATYDLRDRNWPADVRDTMSRLLNAQPEVIRVIGEPVRDAGQLIEITMDTAPMRAAMIEFALRLLAVSAAFSLLTAVLLNLATQRLIVRPIRGVIGHMTAYAASPEDSRTIITPGARMGEVRDAEIALAGLQHTVTASLKQRERLAQLGQAVAKISHDLRNILTTGQILADRLEESADPAVRRAAPKLMGSISRAVNLCETTLAFGKAEEPRPSLSLFHLRPLVAEVIEAEELASEAMGEAAVEFIADIPAGMRIRADRDQLYRVLANLARNARQAIEATRQPGTIEISATEDESHWCIRVGDTGPGLPQKARENLFQPFTGGIRKGGTGLGLAIAADLIRGHGGRLQLARTDETGTEFQLRLPREIAAA